MKPLYQLSADLTAELDAAFDPETGEALPVFEEKRIIWANKAKSIVAYMLNREAEQAMLTEAIKRMQKRLKSAKRASEWLHDYLAENMATTGISKIDAEDGSFQATLYLERDVSVEIANGATFPPELCNPPKLGEPSKTLIKAAIEAGEPIKGAMIVRKHRLVIK